MKIERLDRSSRVRMCATGIVAATLALAAGRQDGVLLANVASEYVSGRVVATDKLVGATISIQSLDGTQIRRVENATGTEGLYDIPRREEPLPCWWVFDGAGSPWDISRQGALLPCMPAFDPRTGLLYAQRGVLPSRFVLVVTGGTTPDGRRFEGRLERVVSLYEAGETYDVNGLTTLVAEYFRAHPSVSYADTVEAVGRYLDIPDARTFADVSSDILRAGAWFSEELFWEAVTTKGLDEVVAEALDGIEKGETSSFADLSRIADLPAILDPGVWVAEVAGAPAAAKAAAGGTAATAAPAPPPAPRPAVAVTAVLSVAADIFEGVAEVMDMEEAEQNTETLNRIDQTVGQMNAQLMDISKQLQQVKDLLVEGKWQAVNRDLEAWELNCIAPARERFQEVILQKKEIAALKPGTSDAVREAARKALDRRIADFRKAMEKGSCDFDTLLDGYANLVTKRDDDSVNSAIQLYTDVLNGRVASGTCTNCTYEPIENTFLRFLYYQAVGLQLHVQHQLLAVTDRKQWKAEQKKIVDRFVRGTAEFEYERMRKQVGRFVPAVESFVVSHTKEEQYRRWLECDFMTAEVNQWCGESERPFLRSQILTDQLLGRLQRGDGTTEPPRYGLFVKAVQLVTPGVDGLARKALVFEENGVPTEVYPTLTRIVTGGNPYPRSTTSDEARASWQIATYSIFKTAPRNLVFRLKYDGNDSANPVHFRDDVELKALTETGTNYRYNAFSLWTVPVRDLTSMAALYDNYWGSYRDLGIVPACYASGWHGNAQDTCDVQSKVDQTGSPLRFYRLRVATEDVAIGFRGAGGERFLWLPALPWNSVNDCSARKVLGQRYFDSPDGGNDPRDDAGNRYLYWTIKPSGWNAEVFTFARGTWVLDHPSVFEKALIYYGEPGCKGLRYGFKPKYANDWH